MSPGLSGLAAVCEGVKARAALGPGGHSLGSGLRVAGAQAGTVLGPVWNPFGAGPIWSQGQGPMGLSLAPWRGVSRGCDRASWASAACARLALGDLLTSAAGPWDMSCPPRGPAPQGDLRQCSPFSVRLLSRDLSPSDAQHGCQ